jgi:hypothetical protein
MHFLSARLFTYNNTKLVPAIYKLNLEKRLIFSLKIKRIFSNKYKNILVFI